MKRLILVGCLLVGCSAARPTVRGNRLALCLAFDGTDPSCREFSGVYACSAENSERVPDAVVVTCLVHSAPAGDVPAKPDGK